MLPLALVRRALLGSVVNLLAAKLPQDELALAELMKSEHDKIAPELIREGLEGATPALNDYLQRALKNTVAQTQAILARRGT